MIKKGDKVKLYPHGSPEQAVEATVILYGKKDHESIMLSVDHVPGFVRGVAIHPELGVVFMASNYGVGPWVELFNEGHYEIEEIQ